MNDQACLLCSSPQIGESYDGPFRILHCNNCGLSWIDDPMSHLTDQWFDNYYTRRKSKSAKESHKKREQQYVIDSLFVKRHLKDGDRVLDVGCSYGKFLDLVSRLRIDLHCTGIDIDGSAISEANLQFGSSSNFLNKSLLSFDDEFKFDVIIFRGTLQYHGENFRENISKLWELLNPGGKILVFSLPSTDAFMYNLLGHKWALFHPEMQLMFNERSVRFMAREFGFLVNDLSYPYLEDIYSNPVEDYENVKKIILGESQLSSPFWGSIMRVVFSKDPVI